MAVSKYRNVSKSLDGQPLHWGRADIDNLPFKGEPMFPLKSDELDLLLVPAMDVYVRQYDLSDEEQRKEYEMVLDRAANGWYKIMTCDVKFIEEERKWIALIVFGERYMTLQKKPQIEEVGRSVF